MRSDFWRKVTLMVGMDLCRVIRLSRMRILRMWLVISLVSEKKRNCPLFVFVDVLVSFFRMIIHRVSRTCLSRKSLQTKEVMEPVRPKSRVRCSSNYLVVRLEHFFRLVVQFCCSSLCPFDVGVFFLHIVLLIRWFYRMIMKFKLRVVRLFQVWRWLQCSSYMLCWCLSPLTLMESTSLFLYEQQQEFDESIRISKETIDILKDQVFGFDTFFITSQEPYEVSSFDYLAVATMQPKTPDLCSLCYRVVCYSRET